MAEAIDTWLAQREDAEDRASAKAALREYERDGGVAAVEYARHLAAGAQATYGTDDDARSE